MISNMIMKLVIRIYLYVEHKTSLLVLINSKYAIYVTQRKYGIYSYSSMSYYNYMIHYLSFYDTYVIQFDRGQKSVNENSHL